MSASNEGERLYLRIVTILCHTWGVPPWEIEQREISMREAMEAVMFEACHMEIDVGRYLHREVEADLESRHRQIVALVDELKETEDPDRREELRRQIRDLNRPRR